MSLSSEIQTFCPGTMLENWGSNPDDEIRAEIYMLFFAVDESEIVGDDYGGNPVAALEHTPGKRETPETIAAELQIANGLIYLSEEMGEERKIAFTVDSIQLDSRTRQFDLVYYRSGIGATTPSRFPGAGG